ncbi:CCA tRNA nucleotidyltransferase [Natronosalvus vescus]|uniref:CCA tRNA nucleotidyltransferase n=1 Tax=Natronosalvus vescus TaxID=2953881 RepID=UPI00209113C2|nr:CCA tRNA nucleotidyltransferase [Natronosalvus vescus]
MTDDTARGESNADEADDASTDGEPTFEAVTRAVLAEIEPDENERAILRATATTLLERAATAATDRSPGADVLQVGSSARDTWISGDRDIDIFVRFPPTIDRQTLETYGLEVGHETLPSGHEEYAEHPYVKGEYDGFDVDLVPCFRLEDATDIRSAVDRTPFHNWYLEERLDDDLVDDVRLAKQFLKGIGAYGSNLRTEGFSGYLTELLVVEYGGFRSFLEAAADWHPPVELDPEDHGQATFDDPLIVIDPTDPGRNVAAVCSAENVARVQHYARELLEAPNPGLFDAEPPEPLEVDALETHLERRDTTPVAIRFDAPDVVDDQLYPQLRKSLEGVRRGLDDRGFEVFRAESFADETGVLYLELAVTERPAIERHEGPPVHVRTHAEGFFDAYTNDDTVYGPFLDGDRYVVERERDYRSAIAFLESDDLFGVSLGAHVETALEERYDILVDDEVTALLEEFPRALARFYDPTP